MKYKFCIVVLTILFQCSCKQKEKDALPLGNAPSDIVEILPVEQLYEDLKGNQVLLANYKGKRILLNFWATWCKPCIEEMPALLRSKRILEKENYVFLLASDQSVEKIKAFREKHDFDFNFIRFTGALSQLKIHALPTTFIYNENGEKVDEISGTALWDSQEMIDKLKNVK